MNLLFLEQRVIDCGLRLQWSDKFLYARLVGRHQCLNVRESEGLAGFQQCLQSGLYVNYHGLGGQVQDLEVVDVPALSLRILECIERLTEGKCREQLLPIPISVKSSRLTNQGMNDMAEVNPVGAATLQPRESLYRLAFVDDLDFGRMKPDDDLFAYQARRH